MAYSDVNTLKLAFGWATDFILANGIPHIPKWWAFIIETCGILSWVVMFVFAVALFVGYSRQMSNHYFFYEHITGKRPANPYKPAFLLFLFWCALYVVSGSVTVAGVYFLKYGVFYAFLAALGGVIGLAVLGYVAYMAIRIKPDPRIFAQMPHFDMRHYNPNMIAGQNPSQPAPELTQTRYIGHQAASGQNALQQTTSSAQGASHVEMFEEALLLLGLERGFTKAQLQKRYRELAKKFHADQGGTNGLYLKIKSCYEFLLPFAR